MGGVGWVCMFVGKVHSPMWVHVEVRGQCQVSSSIPLYLTYWERCSHWSCTSARLSTRLGGQWTQFSLFFFIPPPLGFKLYATTPRFDKCGGPNPFLKLAECYTHLSIFPGLYSDFLKCLRRSSYALPKSYQALDLWRTPMVLGKSHCDICRRISLISAEESSALKTCLVLTWEMRQ